MCLLFPWTGTWRQSPHSWHVSSYLSALPRVAKILWHKKPGTLLYITDAEIFFPIQRHVQEEYQGGQPLKLATFQTNRKIVVFARWNCWFGSPFFMKTSLHFTKVQKVREVREVKWSTTGLDSRTRGDTAKRLEALDVSLNLWAHEAISKRLVVWGQRCTGTGASHAWAPL